MESIPTLRHDSFQPTCEMCPYPQRTGEQRGFFGDDELLRLFDHVRQVFLGQRQVPCHLSRLRWPPPLAVWRDDGCASVVSSCA